MEHMLPVIRYTALALTRTRGWAVDRTVTYQATSATGLERGVSAVVLTGTDSIDGHRDCCWEGMESCPLSLSWWYLTRAVL